MKKNAGLAGENAEREPAKLDPLALDSSSIIRKDLYTYQQQTMPVMLGWGVGSLLSGSLWRCSRLPQLRGMGSQFIAWGAVDAAIAVFAIANAVKKSGQVASGEISPHEHRRQAELFRRIVWLNVLLDVGYMLGGMRMIKRSDQDDQRRGMGMGILIQGAFLFVWDILLALFVPRGKP